MPFILVSYICDLCMHLSDYNYKTNFMQVNGLSIHYLDEGPETAPVLMFLHGVPTWAYTFRNIFPSCLKEGYRVIAPDLPGFGLSDKPENRELYSIKSLVEIMGEFIKRLELRNITLFAHDWGAIIGMMLVAGTPVIFSRVITCNGVLPGPFQSFPRAFRLWKIFIRYSPWVPVGRIVNFGTIRTLSKSERRAYDMPFVKNNKKTALRILPQLLPFRNSDTELVKECWQVLDICTIPFLTIFSVFDPFTRGGQKIIQERIPGAKDQAHLLLAGKHFLQEDKPDTIVKAIIEFINSNA